MILVKQESLSVDLVGGNAQSRHRCRFSHLAADSTLQKTFGARSLPAQSMITICVFFPGLAGSTVRKATRRSTTFLPRTKAQAPPNSRR